MDNSKTVEQLSAELNALASEYIDGCNAVIAAWKPKAEAALAELKALPISANIKIAILNDIQKRIETEVTDL